MRQNAILRDEEAAKSFLNATRAKHHVECGRMGFVWLGRRENGTAKHVDDVFYVQLQFCVTTVRTDSIRFFAARTPLPNGTVFIAAAWRACHS